MILHICSESLDLAHYELTFGKVNCPAVVKKGVYTYDRGFSIKGIPYVKTYVTEGNEAEVAKVSPKV